MDVVLVVVLNVAVFGGLVLWQISYNDIRNKKDSRAAAALEEITHFDRDVLAASARSDYGIQSYEGYRLGEITRHFDTNTSATISGWMSHNLGFHGWGLSVAGVGIGQLGQRGVSQVSLSSSGTNRDDLMGDGFVAVFEKQGASDTDTLRVVVPSENATRELIRGYLAESLERLATKKNDKGRLQLGWKQSHSRLKTAIPELLEFKDEASYVSDRLSSILRMPPESRPLVSVFGPPLSEHAIVGAAIKIGDEPPLPLFPVALMKTMPPVVNKAFAELGVTPLD